MDDSTYNSLTKPALIALFVRWQTAAFESVYQGHIRDAAVKAVDDSTKVIANCRSALRAFDIDPDDEAQIVAAVQAVGWEASQLFNQTRPAHLPPWEWTRPEVVGPRSSDEDIAPATPPVPPMPRIKDVVLNYLQDAAAEEGGGAKAAEMRDFIEFVYSTKIHEKTVGMTLYRLLKEGRVRRRGHKWFFVPQPTDTKNPGVSAPGSIEGR